MGRPRSTNPIKRITIGIKVTQPTLKRWEQAWNLYKASAKKKKNCTKEDFLNKLLNSILISEQDAHSMKLSILQAKIGEIIGELEELCELMR